MEATKFPADRGALHVVIYPGKVMIAMSLDDIDINEAVLAMRGSSRNF